MQPFTWNTFFMVLFGSIAVSITHYLPIPINNHYVLIFIKSALFSIIYFIPVYFFNVSEDINSMVDKYLVKVKNNKV